MRKAITMIAQRIDPLEALTAIADWASDRGPLKHAGPMEVAEFAATVANRGYEAHCEDAIAAARGGSNYESRRAAAGRGSQQFGRG